MNRYHKVTCEKCGTETTKPYLARHKKSCSAVTFYRSQCPKFSIKSKIDLNYHIAKKHSAPKPVINFKCKLSYECKEFPGFHALRQHKNTQRGFPIKTEIVDLNVIINEVDNTNSKKELRFCQYFLLLSDLERARHKVFNCAIENPHA